jgi:selenide,water dikinase
VLGKLARQQDPNVLVGFDYADDAGVYRLTPETALVQTVDFFTPIVDDPYTFGEIAATNSLSDVYAMGGKPLTSLALVCFPEKGDLEILERILAGGLSKMMEAGCTVIGGHSIRDEETKFGYSITGLIRPDRVLANKGAQVGDRLLLTKALGTGVISTAIKKGVAQQNWVEGAVKSMTTLNKAATEVITGVMAEIGVQQSSGNDPRRATNGAFAVHALTDITGFGLIGHAREMAIASNVSMVLHGAKIPVLDGALECVRAGHIPGGLKANREFAECVVGYDSAVPDELRTLLFDPQTAGGLLIAISADQSGDLRQLLNNAGVAVVEIGEVTAPVKPLITIS